MVVTERARLRQSDDLFDDSVGYEDEAAIRISVGLSEQEKKQAAILYKLFDGLWGLCIIVGVPGAGKDVFGNYILYSLKRYFPKRKTLRDERPRRLFGHYDGLFNEDVLKEDIERMKEVVTGVSAKNMDAVLDKAADEWVKSDRASILLQDANLYLTEFWRYCNLREPHAPMNKTMGGIHRVYRHYNCLIFGTVQIVSDLDKRTALPFVKWRVTCTRSTMDTTRFTFFVAKVKYDRRMDMLNPISQALAIPVDAGKPRSFMGDGKIVIKRPNYQPQTLEEGLVLDALKAGVYYYEELVTFLEDAGDMSEQETLSTLKHLALKLSPTDKGKFVIGYPCYYNLFVSKSAVQVTTSLKGSG